MNQSPAGALFENPYVAEDFIVVRRRRDTADTQTLQLRRESGNGFTFQPGQFNMLSLPGIGEVPISFSGAADQPDLLEHTIRGVGAVTRGLVSLKAGDRVGVRGPFGHGWPLEEAQGQDVVIVAGGIGLAPLRPAILHILAHRKDYRRCIVLYGSRTPADLLYLREMEKWRGRVDVELRATVDRADMHWRGNIGVVTNLFSQVERTFEPGHTVAMICGPEIMMLYTVRALQERGVPDEHIHVSLERNMKCALAFCGHCQYGPYFICKDGPVFPYSRIAFMFGVREF